MKTFFTFLLFFTFFLTTANSQTPIPCSTVSCSGPQSAWTYEETPISANISNCEMLVYYRWRICDGPPLSREVEILKVELLNGGSCNTTDNGVIMNSAVKAILANYPAIFRDASSYDVTVRTPACVIQAVLNNTNFYTLSNATTTGNCSSDCCERTYSMSFLDGIITCTAQTTNQSTVNCSSPSGLTCETICDYLGMPLNVQLLAKTYDTLWYCTPNGQTEPCNNIVEEGIKTVIHNDNERDILINYLYRKCADRQFEIKVLGIQIIRYTGVWPQYEWIRYSYRVVFKDLTQYTYPPNDYDLYKIGVYVNSCWTDIFGGNPPRRVYIYPCTNTYDCCYRSITVQKQLSGNYAEEHIIILAETPIISNNNNCGYACTYQCNVVQEFSARSGPLPKLSLNHITSTKNNIKIYPNPVENILNIEGDFSFKGDIKISIYDSKGNTLLVKFIDNSSTHFKEKVDISDFVNGIYYYRIIYGKETQTGSFVLLK